MKKNKINERKLYVARDLDGDLNLFNQLPFKLGDDIWSSTGAIVRLPKEWHTSVTWENSPVEVITMIRAVKTEIPVNDQSSEVFNINIQIFKK